ncbi:MAG: hypothetical protein ACNYVW_04210 [Methanosarcinales archaeon]
MATWLTTMWAVRSKHTMRKAGGCGSRIYLMISYSYKEKHKMVVESRLRQLDESGRNRIK